MNNTTLGKTGLNVSKLCLGTWGIGGAGWDPHSEESRVDAIHAAIENGINFFDTAPAYNRGAAERLLGRTLKDMGMREKVVISTKCGNVFENGTTYVHDSRPEVIRKQCEDSLRYLQTDYIDVYLIHWPDPKTPFEETAEVLHQLKDEGKILHVGVSNFSLEQIEELEQFIPVEVYQPQYSMVNRTCEPNMKWATERNIGVMSYGSLGGGILTGAIREAKVYDPSDSRNRFYKHFEEPAFSNIMKLLDVMDEHSAKQDNIPLSWIALNWAMQSPYTSSCIVGAQSRERVIENCRATEWMLADEEYQMLNEAIRQFLG